MIGAGGHHGGAWKVAYADFVTAMMAFFLLMWLLNATTEKQRKGLSDYFNPSVAVNRISGGGDGALGGETMFSQETQLRNGTGGSGDSTPDPDLIEQNAAKEAQEVEKLIETALFDRGGESRTMEQMLRHVTTRVTDEGLVIELFDLDKVSLFESDTATPRPVMQDLSILLAEVLNLTGNKIGIAGHLSAELSARQPDAGWTLSAERAQSIRQLLQTAGVEALRMQRVVGYADRVPAVDGAKNIRNNRIEIILLRRNR